LYKEHLKKLEIQKKEMLNTIENLEQILSTHFHSYDTSLLFEREQQLRSEQQQLYQLITIFEVSHYNNLSYSFIYVIVFLLLSFI